MVNAMERMIGLDLLIVLASRDVGQSIDWVGVEFTVVDREILHVDRHGHRMFGTVISDTEDDLAPRFWRGEHSWHPQLGFTVNDEEIEFTRVKPVQVSVTQWEPWL